MMKIALIKRKANALFNAASFLSKIETESEYEAALEMMEALIEDYEENRPLIALLSNSIEKWEEEAEEFQEFNDRIGNMDNAAAILATLMDQRHLKADDLKNEIGSKSLVSMIINGKRNLTVDHIKSLAKRFSVSPALFLS
jgi:HTH-type transcriptional regulator/antitoxin HigA